MERGKASDDEKKQFSKAVFILQKTVEYKERPVSPQVILAKAANSTELRFDLRQIREQWDSFYRTHNLTAVADLLPQKITLTPVQIETLKLKAQEGYTRIILIPAGIEQHLQVLKANLTDGLEKDYKGKPIKTWLSNEVKLSFPCQIETTDRERVGRAYLLLTNPNESLLPGTKNKSADELIAEFAQQGISGLTLADYLIEEKKHFEETLKHLVDWSNNELTWLLESRDSSARVLRADWSYGLHHVEVG